MGGRKAISLKIHYFHVLTSPLERNFHADPKNGLKEFHAISEGPKFLDWTFGEMAIRIFKNLALKLSFR
jgi:hypothetical protein